MCLFAVVYSAAVSLSNVDSLCRQWRSQTFESGGDKDSDAEGVGYETTKASSGEMPSASRGWVMGRGFPPPQPTRGSGGAS